MNNNMTPASLFTLTMLKRDLCHQVTYDSKNHPETFHAYIGFDLTAPSLHVGSLIQLIMLRWLRETGNHATVLLGETTTRIGDPSGKDSARQMLSLEQIEKNREGIRSVIERIVPGVEFVSNREWMDENTPSFVDFLTRYGPHFTINRMLSMDSVDSRLNRQHPLTFLEFCYSLLQSVDFLELSRRGVNAQIGGSDQWGNITSGIDLIRRMDQRECFAMTTPLLLDRQGNKMGKSQGKPVWLDPEMTSPFDFYQYWRNCDDADVAHFFKMFTMDDLASIEARIAVDINQAKKRLAHLITKIVHGPSAAQDAAERSEAIFERGDMEAATEITVSSPTLVGAMVEAGLAESKGAARRLIAQNAVAVDGVKILDDKASVPDGCILKVGKKAPVKLVSSEQ